MNKKAIELSINFIVITVISILVFSFGIYLMNQFFNYGNKVIFEWDEKHESALEDMMDRGEQVAIPFDHKKIGNTKYDKFAIGIFNTIGDAQNTFTTTVKFTQAYEPDGSSLALTINPNDWLKSATGTVDPATGEITIIKTIKNYEKEKFLVGVTPTKAPEGTYLFEVKVTYGNGVQYGNPTYILIVDVPY